MRTEIKMNIFVWLTGSDFASPRNSTELRPLFTPSVLGNKCIMGYREVQSNIKWSRNVFEEILKGFSVF